MATQTSDRYTSFAEFYPYYLQEHSNPVCRRLHYVGSLLVLGILAYALGTQQWLWLLAMPVAGYGFAWVDRKSTRLNSSHSQNSYAAFCLNKKPQTSRKALKPASRVSASIPIAASSRV